LKVNGLLGRFYAVVLFLLDPAAVLVERLV